MDRKKKDYLLKTLAFQAAICTVLFAALFLLQRSGSPLFTAFHDAFSDTVNDFLSLEEAAAAFGSLRGTAPPGETEPSTGDGWKNTGDSPETSEDFAAAQESEDEDSEPDEALTVQVLAQGGKDASYDSEAPLPADASFAAYRLNQKMVLPLNGELTSPFGFRIHPISGEYGFHYGIDIARDTGTPISAAFDGKVVLASYNQGNGNYLKIQHDNDIMTVYCHCSKLYVKEGTVVRAGEIIAAVGSTGNSTGPHLHFEMRIHQVCYDPLPALKSARRAV